MGLFSFTAGRFLQVRCFFGRAFFASKMLSDRALLASKMLFDRAFFASRGLFGGAFFASKMLFGRALFVSRVLFGRASHSERSRFQNGRFCGAVFAFLGQNIFHNRAFCFLVTRNPFIYFFLQKRACLAVPKKLEKIPKSA